MFAMGDAALVGLGIYGLITSRLPLRKIVSINILGCGVFLLFGVIARRGAAAGLAADPVPQAMVITGIVVAFPRPPWPSHSSSSFPRKRARLRRQPTDHGGAQ